MYIDLNRFKNINDTLGHSIGDRVLKEIANRFRTILPPDISLSRIGGDEFAIIAQNHTEQQLLDLCETLFRITDDPLIVHQHSFYLSLSIGVAVYPFGGTNATTLYNMLISLCITQRKKITTLFVCMTRHYLKNNKTNTIRTRFTECIRK